MLPDVRHTTRFFTNPDCFWIFITDGREIPTAFAIAAPECPASINCITCAFVSGVITILFPTKTSSASVEFVSVIASVGFGSRSDWVVWSHW